MAKKKASHRVHIACFDDGHIVPRMMSWLADGLGWSIGNYLDPDPDVTNYYGPYTMFGQYGRSAGKSTGWFTHMETSNLAKMEIWNRASKAIDLPLLTSPVYQPDLPKSALVTPGVDQNHFVPVNKKLPGKGIVGVVGVPQPRKGLELAKAILDLGVANNVRIVGGQWEGFEKSESIPYEQMPEFYAGIDLLVCTSLEEGIPAPPFEALACGVPVVVPIGVGALDLLPDVPGIYRYGKGDDTAMNSAITVALSEKHDRSTLRDTVAPFTVQAWVDSHAVALEELLHE
jgi:glycosyltransferase involved in cell wall biosynthesis